jgi:SsrA-binding protein
MSNNKKKKQNRVLATNKKAVYNYTVIDSYEAGIVLNGGEVKSAKAGGVSLKESFISVDDGEMWLWNCHISPWQHTSDESYDPTRKRKILMGRHEIDSLSGKVQQKGYTLIPLKMYLTRGLIKLQVGLCKGKKKYDKRHKEKKRTLERDLHEKKRRFMV